MLLRPRQTLACIGGNILANSAILCRLDYNNGNGQQSGDAVILYERTKPAVSRMRIQECRAFQTQVVGTDPDIRRRIETSLSLHVLLEALLGVIQSIPDNCINKRHKHGRG